MKKVAIVGASGYAGCQLVRMISKHSNLELTALFVSENSADKGKKISELYGSLDGICSLSLEPLSSAKDIIGRADAVFLATDHKVSHDLAPDLVEAGIAVFDLSGAFRISNTDVFESAYGFAHEHTDLLKKAVYALGEYVNLDELRNYYHYLPSYWNKLKEIQCKLPCDPMKKASGSVFDLEKRFMLEDKWIADGREKEIRSKKFFEELKTILKEK